MPRSPEIGPAERAGAEGYLIPVTSLETLVVFTIPQEPDAEVRDDLLYHARSAEASVTIIFSPLTMKLYHHREPDPRGWIAKIGAFVDENRESRDFEQDTVKQAEIRSKLTRYLGELRKELNGFIYRRDGETSESLRELTIQTLMNQVLFTRIVNSHRQQQVLVNDRTLLWQLFSYAILSPVHDQYDIRIPDTNPEENSLAMQKFASTRSPALSGIRLSWIEPGTWASVFREHLASSLITPHRRSGMTGSVEIPDIDSVLHTRIGEFITGMLTDILNPDFSGRLYDPSSGNGELIALIMRLHRQQKMSSGCPDTIISRLIMASDLVHASDSSPVQISMVRFIIVISIICGDFRDPSLSGSSLWYPFRALSDQVRAGSILYNPDISEEFFSVAAGYPVLRRLHPLNPSVLIPPGERWTLVLSYPAGPIRGGYPEVISFLTRRYQSFQTGLHPAALLVERTYEDLSPQGISIFFIPSSWLSEDPFRGFRRWVSQHLPAMIIIEEDESGLIDRTGLSVLVLQKKGEAVLKVIRLQKAVEGKTFQPRIFSISPNQLPETDGWRLDETWEEELLKRFGPELMPLSAYLFEEIYEGGRKKGISGNPEGWTSVTLTRDNLFVHQGEKPDPDASAIIPGRDQYLIGLLTSSLIRWYIQAAAGGGNSEISEINRIRNIPIRSIDEYCGDECLIRDSIEESVQRIAMLTRLNGRFRPWHDRERINRQITDIKKKVDLAVCRLYGLTADDCHEIWKKIDFKSG